MKKVKGILLLIVFLFIPFLKLEALSDDSYVTWQLDRGIFAHQYKKGNDRITNLAMMEVNGRISYCVEPGISAQKDAMYSSTYDINDTHIGFYVVAAIVGLLVGQFVDWMNKRLPENKKILTTDLFREYKIDFRPNYILMLVTSAIYVGLVYYFGVKGSIIENLELIKNLLLVPMLLSVFVIDYNKQIIPNRLNLTMFEVGLVIAFLYGFSNVAITIDMLFGMLIGGGIFLIITLIGRLIYGKEAMGFGDVKFMAALGLYFGFVNTALISLTSFLLGAIIGIILIVFKVKKSNEYMPFGPFIVMAALICIFVPSEILLNVLKTIFTLGISK
mgnify:CR=1 FL=1